jgi:hypothetical protein
MGTLALFQDQSGFTIGNTLAKINKENKQPLQQSDITMPGMKVAAVGTEKGDFIPESS